MAVLVISVCGVGYAGNLNVPRDGMTIDDNTVDTWYNSATVNGPLQVQGSHLFEIATTCRVGPNPDDTASITVSGGARFWIDNNKTATYGEWGGPGGKLTLSSPTAFQPGWDGNKAAGTFGGRIKHIISSALTLEGDVYEMAELGNNGWLGAQEISNEKAVAAEIQFNGGGIYLHTNSGDLFQAVEGGGFVLKSLNAEPIQFRGLLCSDYDLLTGAGYLKTEGAGDVDIYCSNTPEVSLFKLQGDIRWNHTGTTIVRGNVVLRPLEDNKLPCGPSCGTLTIGPGAKSECRATLDLNGTVQKVNGILLKDNAVVCNTSTERATLEVGEFASGLVMLDGTFSGPIDIRVKAQDFRKGASLKLENGARLFFDEGTKISLSDVAIGAIAEGNPCGGAVTVANSHYNVSSDPSYVKNDARRDRAPSTATDLVLTETGSLDVRAGALAVSRFSAEAGASVHVGADCELRVQSQGGLSHSYLRFVFKEAYGILAGGVGSGKYYPHIKHLFFWTTDGTRYYPGDNGYVRVSADTALGDMPKGSYKFHSDKFAVGRGADLDPVNVGPYSQARSSDYNSYGGEGFFASDSSTSGLMFTNAIPKRGTSSTWHTITVKMGDGAPSLSGYSISSLWDYQDYPVCWSVEASDDGDQWITLDEKTDYYSHSYHDATAGKEGYDLWNYVRATETAFPFYWTQNVAAGTTSFSLGGAKLRIDRDGLLDVSQTGGSVEVAVLEIDAQAGGGRMTSFKPMPNGVLNIVNAAAPGDLLPAERKLHYVFDEVVDPENLNTWKVFSNGEEIRDAKVRLVAGGIKVSGWGYALTVR